MPAKPWSTGSVASVASHFTNHRLSGDVKKQLVELLSKKLDEIIVQLEEETISKDPETR